MEIRKDPGAGVGVGVPGLMFGSPGDADGRVRRAAAGRAAEHPGRYRSTVHESPPILVWSQRL
jgi:hypothetical protein